MDALDRLAEKRIREAIERGELAGLEGAGRPLRLSDESMIAPELRAAYRVLRNAGFVPEEVTLRRELGELEELVDQAAGTRGEARALGRLAVLRSRLSSRPGGERSLVLHDDYRRQVLDRLGGNGAGEVARQIPATREAHRRAADEECDRSADG